MRLISMKNQYSLLIQFFQSFGEGSVNGQESRDFGPAIQIWIRDRDFDPRTFAKSIPPTGSG